MAGRSSRSLKERFESRVNQQGPIRQSDLGRCWIWTGSTNIKGYGRIGRTSSRKIELAHRIAWELENGPIASGVLVCHHCDNPPCVRVSHLFLSTPLGNMQDMASKGRHYTPFGTGGEGHHNAKLTDLQVLAIREMRGPASVIAAEFGVAKCTINRIRSGASRQTAGAVSTHTGCDGGKWIVASETLDVTHDA